MGTLTTPEAVVAAQLLAYNAKDIEVLLSLYAEDAEQYEHPNTLLAKGRNALRPRFAARFAEPDLHAHLIGRTVMGSFVIDHERVDRTFPEGKGSMDMVCLYEVAGETITKAWFIFGEKRLA